MKQLFIILVLITVLISIGGENSYALERPNGIGSLERPDPDDHPWGGEDQYNPIESSRTIKEPLQIKTGFMFIDIFYDFFFEIIYVDLSNSTTVKSTTRITSIYSTETEDNLSTYQESYSKGK